MSKIAVYSCVTGGYDNLKRTLLSSKPTLEHNVTYTLFLDNPKLIEAYQGMHLPVDWDIRPVHWKHPMCSRRTARWHKVNSHILFPEAEYVVWFDGSQRIKPVSITSDLVLPHTKEASIASFKHPDRTCIYQEVQACRRFRKDNPMLMQQQVQGYRKENYPPFNGLVETACVVRKHGEEVIRFNKAWWKEIEKHSYRDQLSFNYVAWKLNIPYAHIPGHRSQSIFCDFVPHGR